MTPRRAAVGIAFAGALLSLVAAPACGSDCTETLTCADQPGDDGSPAEAGGDRSLSDQNTGGDRGADAGGGDTTVKDVSHPPPDACDKASAEDCTNGFDDNCDGKIDCADPMCVAQAFTCVPAAPNGWSGPAAYYSGASAAPGCPSAYPSDSLDGKSSPSQTPAMCTCTCGSPQGASCSNPTLTYYGNASCLSSCGTSTLPGNTCVAAPCGTADSVSTAAPTVQGGSCTPVASKSVPQLQWGDEERACTGPVGGGCGAGMVCAAATMAPFGATQCVYQTGQQSCPSQYPNAAATTFGGANDTRDCSACTCGGPTGLSCSVPDVTLYADVGCQLQDIAPFPANGACVSGGFLRPPAAAKSGASTLQGNGSCPTMGGAAQGTVTPTMPTTVCCL